MSYASSILLEELSEAAGGSAAVLRTVTLVGGGLPFMGVNWGFTGKVTTTWYPGNPDDASQQSLGPRDDVPTKWSGEWDRLIMGRLPSRVVDEQGVETQVVDPAVLSDFLEAVLRGQRRLRVSWITETDAPPARAGTTSESISKRIVREGRCTSFEIRPKTIHQFEWSAEFAWASRGKSRTAVTSTRSSTIGNNASAYNAKLAAIRAANATALLAKFNPKSLTIGQLEAFAKGPLNTVNALSRNALSLENQLSSIVNLARTIAVQPLAITNAALNHARNALSLAKNAYASLTRTPPELMSAKSNARDVVRAFKTFGPVADGSRQAIAASVAFLQQLRAGNARSAPPLSGGGAAITLPPNSAILALYTTRDGDTPMLVSQTFYGTPDHAVDILRANHLAWHLAVFPSGKTIRIPSLSGADASTGA